MADRLRLAVIGASGRMGRELIRCIHAAEDLQLASAVCADGDTHQGEDAGLVAGIGELGVLLSPELSGADFAIEFTRAGSCAYWAKTCARLDVPLISGTTDLGAEDEQALAEAAASIPVLWAANFSLGMQILLQLTERAAELAGDSADYEIFEAHHRYKKDAPSGTALALGRRLNRGRNHPDEAAWNLGRGPTSEQRAEDEIGFSSLRAGDIAGEHTVLLGLDGERLELTHRAASRQAFVRGAISAGRWLVKQAPGRYELTQLFAAASRGH